MRQFRGRQPDNLVPLNPAALHGYLCFSHVPAGLSLLGEPTLGEPPVEPVSTHILPPIEPISESTAVETLHHLLRDAVANRLGNEREVGVYLSGGLDSSLVAALLHEAGATVHLFTLDFGSPHNIEVAYAQAVADHLNRPLNLVRAEDKDIHRALDATFCALPQPFGDGVTVPLYLLGQRAKEFTTTIWNGEGGDQLFGGWANKPMIAATLYDGVAPSSETSRGADATNEVEAYLATYHRFYGLTDRLYTRQARERTASVNIRAFVTPALRFGAENNTAIEAQETLIHRLRAANLVLKGAQNIVPRMNYLAQCHGLRVCAPLFDSALTDWTFTLPPTYFLNGAQEKFILKRVAERYLPAEIVWREKRGMGVPTAEWCLRKGFWRSALRRRIEDSLSSRRLRPAGWFESEFVRQLLRGEDPTPAGFRRRRVGEKLWALFALSQWLEGRGH